MRRWLATVWYVLTLRCEEAERVRAMPEGLSTPAQRIGERVHRALCSSCREARRKMQKLEEAVHRLAIAERGEEEAAPAGSGLDAAARARILARLEERERSR